MKPSLCLLLLLNCFLLPQAQAAGAGDEVVIVYNRHVSESRQVAQYYAQRRQVPTNQIFGFDLPTGEDMTRAEFRDSLQRPLFQALRDANLWHVGPKVIEASASAPRHVQWRVQDSKIRYAVLCYGVPLRILHDPTLKEEGADQIRVELRRDEAAVDSELALLPCLEEHLPLNGLLRNPLYGATNETWVQPTNGVLMVTRLDGPTAQIACGLVDKALEAESNGFWGRAYFDLRNIADPALKQGDDWIHGAAQACYRLGLETTSDENPATFPDAFPMSQIALYIGWYTEHVCGPLARPQVEFMPGAFAYHLHSFSAYSLRSTNTHWVGPFLAKGVTITMGCVNEPYLGGTPDMTVFTTRLLFNCFDFGAAAYACQSCLSWQTTVVGDPLYRPYGRNPQELHEALQRSQNKNLEWSYLRLADLNLANGHSPLQVAALLEDLPLTKQSAVLSEKLADLYALLGKPTSAIYATTQALALNPTPQQRVRLRIELADRLQAQDKTEEVYADFQKLLEETPDYPDRLAVDRRLLSLALRLNKAQEVEKYQVEINQLSPPAPPTIAPPASRKTEAALPGKS